MPAVTISHEAFKRLAETIDGCARSRFVEGLILWAADQDDTIRTLLRWHTSNPGLCKTIVQRDHPEVVFGDLPEYRLDRLDLVPVNEVLRIFERYGFKFGDVMKLLNKGA